MVTTGDPPWLAATCLEWLSPELTWNVLGKSCNWISNWDQWGYNWLLHGISFYRGHENQLRLPGSCCKLTLNLRGRTSNGMVAIWWSNMAWRKILKIRIYSRIIPLKPYRGFSIATFDYRTETWGEHKCGMGDERKNGWWLSPQTLKCMNVIGDYHKLSFDCGDNTYWNLRPNGVCMFGLKQQPVLVQLTGRIHWSQLKSLKNPTCHGLDPSFSCD